MTQVTVLSCLCLQRWSVPWKADAELKQILRKSGRSSCFKVGTLKCHSLLSPPSSPLLSLFLSLVRKVFILKTCCKKFRVKHSGVDLPNIQNALGPIPSVWFLSTTFSQSECITHVQTSGAKATPGVNTASGQQVGSRPLPVKHTHPLSPKNPSCVLRLFTNLSDLLQAVAKLKLP